MKMNRLWIRIVKVAGIIAASVIIVLFIVSQILYRIYLPRLWENDMYLLFQERNVSIYASKSYGDKDMFFLSQLVNKAMRVLERKNIIIRTEVSLYFTCDLDEYEKLTLTKSSQSCALTLYGENVFFSPVKLKGNHFVIDGDSAIDVIAHELTHVYQYNKLKFHGMFVDKWKIEGHADYIAENSILSLIEGMGLFMYNRDCEDNVCYLYFVGRLRTDYLLRHKGVLEDEYWETNYDEKALDEEIRTAFSKGEYDLFGLKSLNKTY